MAHLTKRNPTMPSCSATFHRLHRMGLIACYYRAAEWEHTEVMRAAHNLLLYFDKSKT